MNAMEVDALEGRCQDMVRTLTEVAAELTRLAPAIATRAVAGTTSYDLANLAREIYAQRCRRGKFFDARLFAEPAWDMLLDLFIAELGHKRLSTTGLCVGCGVPLTTGLRWIGVLEDLRLVDRTPDNHDRRCSYVALTPGGRASMRAYLEALIASTAAIGSGHTAATVGLGDNQRLRVHQRDETERAHGASI